MCAPDSSILARIKSRLKADKRLLAIYLIVYFLWGVGMNEVGKTLEIARFTYWWQVITVYLLYMVPVSLVLRPYPFFKQYAYGLVAMAFLEFWGYLLETSYAYPGNILDQWLGIRNFSLAMSLFFALYFPLGNWLVEKIYRTIFSVKD
ncbi:hypothetical protein [Lentiprolixibacter aurantiacus]|uniref:Uncharacterized protein n=1 Tax=Lentiprolixibacter aurantiacus TaxID=2993939 RepID=A0AAE3SPP5_9FLAO|nr:hypothetical protein [Lentiprolixibacter aurantiacus]MCX2719642.1 hypothetical protein [Lentiprolixibacter aurantiacus]